MYLDPFRSPNEVPVESLHSQLRTMGLLPGGHASFLGPASVTSMAIRVCHNIINTTTPRPTTTWQDDRPLIDRELALYTAVWALHNLDRSAPAMPGYSRFWHFLLSKLGTYPEDVALYEDHIRNGAGGDNPESERVLLNTILAEDAQPKPPKPRSGKGPKYRVGQFFRHKRYDYHAIITGWDTQCEAGENWERQMRVNRLPGGSKQAFYHVLVEDGSSRYVAEENIEVVTHRVPGPWMMRMAGRYFKRWDKERGEFVSNRIREFPDD
jgi:F-box protein 21